MAPDLARLVVIEAFHAGNALQSIMQPLKTNLEEAHYKSYALAIARCIALISDEILERVYAECPGLKEQVSANIESCGRAF